MVLTNCNMEFLPLDSESATQTTFYKNEHHHNHINALHRQNATFNLLNSHTIPHLNNNNSTNFGTVSTVDKGNAPILSSNGYYGYVNNFSAANNHSLDDGTQHDSNQQAENRCTDSDAMCVDDEVIGATGILPFQSVCVVVDKRKRLDEGLDGFYEPAKRRRFINDNDDTTNLFYKPVNIFKTNHVNYHRTNISSSPNSFKMKPRNASSSDDLESLFYNTHGSALFYYQDISED
ncbi:uncharacterized protein LOC134837115 isoform X1 [Culicoides brevitarsis]|uniref:uncharacterized protein LOC134837115 isoform X1 n=1 Tax=Culicoides brevitarsis TaxID=469753 RepID=UPI00307B1DAA